jgi:dethiobiotin synthetase
MIMIKGIFVTGTDTGVGKTYVARGIARTLKQTGIDVGVMKPAETGCHRRAGRLVPADAAGLMRSARVDDRLELVNPYQFSRPLAPSLAAAREGKRIDPDRIITSFRTLSRRHDFMIVEGAGGIMAPLSGDYLFLDLAADLRLPVMIVSRPGLGTINHTLLTISAIKARGLKICGIVINYAGDGKNGLAERTARPAIETLSGVRVLGVVRNKEVNFDAIVSAL